MSEHHSDSLVPSKFGKISSFARLSWYLIALIALTVVVLFFGKFDTTRLWGAGYYINKTQQAVSAKNWPAAIEALQHIAGRDREREDYLRVLADFLEATHSEPAMLDATLVKLDAQGRMLPVDFIWACRLRLGVGNIEAARKLWNRIPAASRQTAEGMKLMIELLKEEGRPQEAAAQESLLFEKFANDPETAVRKAAADLKAAFPELQNAALLRLWHLAEEENEYSLNAIQLLSQQNNLTLFEATRLLALADKQVAITPAERLKIVSMVMRLDSSRREDLLKGEIAHYYQGGTQILAQLVSWLAEEKEYETIKQLVLADSKVPKDALMKSPELFTCVVQGLAGQERWSELLALIPKGEKLPVSNALAATWRALAASHLRPDDIRESRAHLEEALSEAKVGKNQFVLSLVGRMAEERNMADLALQAYQVLAGSEYGQEIEMLDKCWQMATLLKDSGVLLRIAERLAKIRPENLQWMRRRDFLRLLRGERFETVMEDSLNPLPKDGEGQGGFYLLCALKAYRFRDLAQMAANLNKIETTVGLSAGERAVCAGLLAISGKIGQAFQLAEGVSTQMLLKEETVLWEKAL
jgi:hypothetical protein